MQKSIERAAIARGKRHALATHIISRHCIQKLAGASLLIFANKQDLAGALTVEDISDVLQLSGDDISGRHWTISGCSAMTGEGLEPGIDWIVNDIASRIFMMS